MGVLGGFRRDIISDVDKFRPGFSGTCLSTRILSHTLSPRPKEGIEVFFLFFQFLGEPLNHTIRNASLVKMTRAGTFPLAPPA